MPEAPEPDLAELRRRIRLADAAGHVATVAHLCREYLEHDPDNGLVWRELGEALWPLARYGEAARALRTALALCPSEFRRFIYLEFGHMQRRRGKYRSAARWYRKLIDALPDDAGMLFDLHEMRIPVFWMKGMRFPLDMVWIGEDRRVAEVTANVSPQPGVADGDLARISPASPVRYVLELNAGAAGRYGLGAGTQLAFDLPLPTP